MRSGFITSLPALLVAAGLSTAQMADPVQLDKAPNVLAPTSALPVRPGPMPVEAVAGGDYSSTAPTPWVPPYPAPNGPGIGKYGEPFDPHFNYSHGPWNPGSRFWFNTDYLLWWVKDGPIPALVGVAPATTAPPPAGVLPGTTGLLAAGRFPGGTSAVATGRPDAEFEFEQHSGIRLSGGMWLDPAQRAGLEGSFFTLERRTASLPRAALANQAFGPLYFDPILGSNVLLQIARPIPASRFGSVNIDGDNKLWGAEANARFDCTVFSDRTDFIIGFRHIQFSESLAIHAVSNGVPGDPITDGTSVTKYDSFGTHNQFYGPQIGFAADRRYGDWFLDITGKLALGLMHQVVNINGFSTATLPGSPALTVPGGVFALPNNIGRHTEDRVAVIPEIIFTVGRQITPRLRAAVSWNFLYLSDVLRPGEQITRTIDSRPIPFAASPADPRVPVFQQPFGFRTSEVWAQGFNFSLEFRY